MQDHTVTIDQTNVAAPPQYSPVFNATVIFVDRHLDQGRGDKIAIRTADGEQVSYTRLAERTNRAGNALLGLGAQAGDRILMVVKDCPEFYYLFWGAIKAGLIPVPVNTLLRAGDYSYIISDSECGVLVYSTEFAAEVEPALQMLDSQPQHCLRVKDDGTDFISLLESASEQMETAPTTAMDDCFWLYSSGSTGRPKGTIHRHRDMVVSSQKYGVDTLGVREDDVCFSAAKLFFAYGLGNGMTFPLWCGATAILYDKRPTPESTFEIIEKFRPTLYFGVPTLYAAQLARLSQLEEFDQQTPDLSSVRVCVSAGEALPADIYNRWKQRTGLDILDGIGSTEALHIFISNRLDDIKVGTSGLPVPGYEAKILNEQNLEAAPGESGQLMIKGDSNAYCYWNNPEKTAATMVGDWLNTGDTYVRDEQGYFHYFGRNDDMLKVGGIWCSPFEIEGALTEHPAVLEVAVVGRADDQGLIKPEAHIVLHDQSDAGEEMTEQLLQHCKETLAPYKYPRWIHYVDDLPKTATGKIQRFKLRA